VWEFELLSQREDEAAFDETPTWSRAENFVDSLLSLNQASETMASSRQNPQFRAHSPLADLRCVLNCASAILRCQESLAVSASKANFYGSNLPMQRGGQYADAGVAEVDKSLWLGSNGNGNTPAVKLGCFASSESCVAGPPLMRRRKDLSADVSLMPDDKHISIIEPAKTHREEHGHFLRG